MKKKLVNVQMLSFFTDIEKANKLAQIQKSYVKIFTVINIKNKKPNFDLNLSIVETIDPQR